MYKVYAGNFNCTNSHKFKVPPDRLRDLWFGNTNCLYRKQYKKKKKRKKEGNSEGKLLTKIKRHMKQIDWPTSIYSDFDSSPQTGEQMSFIFLYFHFYLLCVWVWGEGLFG